MRKMMIPSTIPEAKMKSLYSIQEKYFYIRKSRSLSCMLDTTITRIILQISFNLVVLNCAHTLEFQSKLQKVLIPRAYPKFWLNWSMVEPRHKYFFKTTQVILMWLWGWEQLSHYLHLYMIKKRQGES